MYPGSWAVDLRALILFFTAGVLGAHGLSALPPPSWLILASLPALLPWRGRAVWAATVLGALLTVWRAQGLLDERWPADRHGTDHWVAGTVVSLPEREGENWNFLFEPHDEQFPRRLSVSWYRTQALLQGGDCWRFELRLRTPHGSLNPGGFDYEGWLFRQGIGARATVRKAERCTAARSAPVLRLRQDWVGRIRQAVPEARAAAMLAALTVGDTSGFSDSDWDRFRVTGTSHLVAISGFNIAIVAGVAFFLCRWLWSLIPRLCQWLPAQRAGLLGSALLAGAYALLAGFEPPVQRAVLMLWIVLGAVWMHRLSEPSRVFALAWLAVLLLDPLAITSPGLWLSFGAVAAIFYVSLGRLRAPGLWHGLVFLQLLLAVALAPLTLYFFQGASWIAPLVNLVAVPLFVVLTPWVLGAVLLYLLSPELGQPVLDSATWALEEIHVGLDWAAQLPDLWLPASPPTVTLVLALCGVALLFAPRGLPLRPLGAICLLPLLAAPVSSPRNGFEVAALDVGQGLAVVVRTRHHTLLYDAGPAFENGFDAGESVVAPYLLRLGLRRLDLLFLSHGDNDHSGGIASVRKLLRVNAEIGTPETAVCQDGMAWVWDGVRFEVLHPDDTRYSENNASCVLKISGPFSVLLAGDIEAAAEARLLRDHAGALRAEVLIAPHHGSKTSSTSAFVEEVHPQVVVYGAGWRNQYRHPRPEVRARYAALGALQYITGNSGAVRIWREANDLAVEEWRRETAKFWNAKAEQ
ncbi:MAG: DNA internalization-related competence protein ComEC/Rec2 [Nevskiales bacterium]|nr:DNA internalization-related competence protein ComEC/Rec2 [Nevskiales bacterium]